MKRVAFKTNPARMGFRELYRAAGGGGIGILACALKLVRLMPPDLGGFGIRAFGDRLERKDMDDLPDHVLEATENYKAKVRKLGFVPGFAYSLTAYGAQEGHAQTFRHKDGTGAVNVLYCRMIRNDTETETTVFGYATPLRDDTYVMTSGNKRLMDKPPSFLCEYHPNWSPKDVWERHLDRVEQAGVEPRKVRTDDDLERIVLYAENEEVEFNLERGVYVRMSRSEIELGEELREEFEQESGSGRRGRRRRDDEDDEDDYDDRR